MVSGLVFSGCGGGSDGDDTGESIVETTGENGEYNIENLFLLNQERRGATVSSGYTLPMNVSISSRVSNDQNFFNIFFQDTVNGTATMETSFIFTDNKLSSIIPIDNIRCDAESIAVFPKTADINDTATLPIYICNDGSTLQNVTWSLLAEDSEEELIVVFKLDYDAISPVGRLTNQFLNSFFIKNNEIDQAILGIKFPTGDNDIANTIFSKE